MENGVAANIVLYRYGIKVFAVRKSIFRLVFGTGGVIAVGTGSNQKALCCLDFKAAENRLT